MSTAAVLTEPAGTLMKALAATTPLADGAAATLGAPTAAEAARFLAQASFAATTAEIARVQRIGYSAWLDQQFRAPRSQKHLDWLKQNGYVVPANLVNFNGIENTIWRKLISSPDLLRQRVVLALSEIFVVSLTGLQSYWRGPMATHYVDLLETHAFGNYRDLLEAVTLSPCMGFYLNMRGNQKGDPTTGREPDENYAREILQLFSIGLPKLAPGGQPFPDTEVYDQDTVTNLARVFTGWNYDGGDKDPAAYEKPMVLYADKHDGGAKTFLGTTVAAGTSGQAAMKQALDTIANHRNVGPFIGRQLIQRLVTSNPSPPYIRRVADVFNNDGTGQRGNLQAVIKAVLMDPDARRAPNPRDTTRGRLRPPMQRFLQWARTFKVASKPEPSDTESWRLRDLSDAATGLGQSPFRSPSVFNFYRPGYQPPNVKPTSGASFVAPEFQINNETTIVGWSNFAQQFIANGRADAQPDYRDELVLAADPQADALVRHVALLLAADGLSPATLTTITNAVMTIAVSNDIGRLNRVRATIHLVMCSPEYLVQI